MSRASVKSVVYTKNAKTDIAQGCFQKNSSVKDMELLQVIHSGLHKGTSKIEPVNGSGVRKSTFCQIHLDTIEEIIYILECIRHNFLNFSVKLHPISRQRNFFHHEKSVIWKIEMKKKSFHWLSMLEMEGISGAFVLGFLLSEENFTSTDRRIRRRKGYTSGVIKGP